MVRPVVRRPCGGGRARRGTAPTPTRILLDAARSFVPPARSPLVTPSYTVILSACHALRDQRGAGGHACQQQNVPALCRPVQRTWSSLSLFLSASLHLSVSRDRARSRVRSTPCASVGGRRCAGARCAGLARATLPRGLPPVSWLTHLIRSSS